MSEKKILVIEDWNELEKKIKESIEVVDPDLEWIMNILKAYEPKDVIEFEGEVKFVRDKFKGKFPINTKFRIFAIPQSEEKKKEDA